MVDMRWNDSTIQIAAPTFKLFFSKKLSVTSCPKRKSSNPLGEDVNPSVPSREGSALRREREREQFIYFVNKKACRTNMHQTVIDS